MGSRQELRVLIWETPRPQRIRSLFIAIFAAEIFFGLIRLGRGVSQIKTPNSRQDPIPIGGGSKKTWPY